MAAQLFNRIGQMGLGVALVGGVVNSALYNGKYLRISQGITIVNLDLVLRTFCLHHTH